MGTDAKDSATDSGKADRMAAWVRDHGAVIRGYLWGIVRRADTADDLTQEVFYRAWRHRDGYREQGQARAFLLRIADRLACDQLRRDKANMTRIDRIRETASSLSSHGDPAKHAADAEAAELLAAALDRLNEIQRRVLLLRYYGALPFNEIAETLGIPLSTALSHCHRGLRTLRTELAERET
jgi:RNA polymerase sigma-70 factor (ECF subfamily)